MANLFFISYTDPFRETSEGAPRETLVMNATRNITRTAPATITDNIVEGSSVNNKSLADHYFTGNQTATFDGVITDVGAGSGSIKTTGEYLYILQKLWEVGQPITLITGDVGVDDSGALGSFNVMENCLFERFSVTQDSTHGVMTARDRTVKAYKVSFQAKQVRFGTEATEATVKVAGATFKKTAQEKQERENTTLSRSSQPAPPDSQGGYTPIDRKFPVIDRDSISSSISSQVPLT
jgi:hypothetical protein